tara:strand:- start:213 stop:419 length:207 start_codon:yes stop_codon:yes gene_type:complete
VIVTGLAPGVFAFPAVMIAGLNGYTQDEGHADPCIFTGHDWGNALSCLPVMIWPGLALFSCRPQGFFC